MQANRYSIGVRIDGQDIGPYIIAGGRIDYGAESRFEMPQPPLCELTLFTLAGWPQMPVDAYEFGVGDWGAASGFAPDHDTQDEYAGGGVRLYIGAPVWVSVTTDSGFIPTHDTNDVYDGAEFRRFTGTIQSIDYETESITLTCVADIERWSRLGIMDFTSIPWDQEPDTVRATDVATRTPAPTTLHIYGNPGPDVIPLTKEDFPLCLGEYLERLATDCDGLFYADREGRVIYRSRKWQRPGIVDIPSGIIRRDVGMTLETGLVQNDVTVEYGVPNTFGERAREGATDTASKTRYGVRTGFYTSQLALAHDASEHALTILDTYSEPTWQPDDVALVMSLADDATVAEVCALDLGSRVRIDPLPPGAPIPYITSEVLGYSEFLSSTEWEMSLHLGAPLNIHVGG